MKRSSKWPCIRSRCDSSKKKGSLLSSCLSKHTLFTHPTQLLIMITRLSGTQSKAATCITCSHLTLHVTPARADCGKEPPAIRWMHLNQQRRLGWHALHAQLLVSEEKTEGLPLLGLSQLQSGSWVPMISRGMPITQSIRFKGGTLPCT